MPGCGARSGRHLKDRSLICLGGTTTDSAPTDRMRRRLSSGTAATWSKERSLNMLHRRLPNEVLRTVFRCLKPAFRAVTGRAISLCYLAVLYRCAVFKVASVSAAHCAVSTADHRAISVAHTPCISALTVLAIMRSPCYLWRAHRVISVSHCADAAALAGHQCVRQLEGSWIEYLEGVSSCLDHSHSAAAASDISLHRGNSLTN